MSDNPVVAAESEDRTTFVQSLAVSFGVAYALYYLVYVVKKPSIAANSKLRKFLESHCPILSENFWPTIWCSEARTQTILRSLFKSCPKIPYSRELLSLPDGGQVALDWVMNDSSPIEAESRPIVIILPGLVGSSQESYALHLALESTKLGFRSVVFNYRGNGGIELKTCRTYSAASTEDLACVVAHVSQKFPSAPVMATGVSLGGMILTNYVAKTGKACGLKAAMTVSVPWNIFESSKSLEKPINAFVFNKMLCNHLKQSVVRNEHLFKDKFDLKSVYESQTIRDFDDRFTSKVFGYQSCIDYYNDACIDKKVHDIKVPLLNLNAADDPFAPEPSNPIEEANRSSSVAIVVTSRGGHIAFFDGFFFPNGTGYMERVFAQFSKAIFNHGEELHLDDK